MTQNEIDAINKMIGVWAEQEDLREEEAYLDQLYFEQQRYEDDQRQWNEYFEQEYRAGRM